MSRIKSVFLVAFILMTSLFVKGQALIDTVKVPVQYVIDSASFATTTGWVYKVTTYEYQFVQQQAPQGVDSFTVKKQKVPVGFNYYSNVSDKTTKQRPLWVLFEFKKP